MILIAPKRRIIGRCMELTSKTLRDLALPLEWDDSELAGFANIFEDLYVTYYIIFNEVEERYDCFVETGQYMKNEEDYKEIETAKTDPINEEEYLETLKEAQRFCNEHYKDGLLQNFKLTKLK